jgi:peptidoglycan/xylan/chitin deacetylase (PgdA/CDA1 family)
MRRLVLTLLHVAGITRLWRWWHRNHITILMVHGVLEDVGALAWAPLRPSLPRRQLERCLRVLASRYRFVSLDEAVAMLRGQIPMRPHSLVLTFDDGYRNQIRHALPVLRRWGAPGAFFLTTGHVQARRPFWFDRLDYALQQVPVDGRKVRVGPETFQIAAADRSALRQSYKTLRDTAKAVSRSDGEMLAEMEALADELEAESGRRLADVFEDDDASSLLSWGDIARATADDVTFGSHTVDHIRLACVELATAEDQLRRSKADLETHTGRPCHYVCYPNGSVSAAVAALAARCDYTAALTSQPGFNRVGDDPMMLKRINFPESGGTAEILAEVSGLAGALSDLLARVRGRRTEGQEE